MPDTSFDTFIKYRTQGHEPLLGFKWVCTSLPYGMPVQYVESIQLPFVNLSVKDGLFAAGTYSYFPGFSDIDQFTMTFHESISGLATRWILYWKSRIKDFDTGAYYLPANYKEDITFSLLDNRNNSVMDITLVDVWPATVDPFDLNYTDPSARIQVSATFSVDDQKIVINEPSLPAAGSERFNFFNDFKSNITDTGFFSGKINFDANKIVEGVNFKDVFKYLPPIQNPLPKFNGAFDALGNAAKGFGSSIINGIKDLPFIEKLKDSLESVIPAGAAEYAANLIPEIDALSGIVDGQTIATAVLAYKTGNEDALVAGISNGVSEVLFNGLLATPGQERDLARQEQSSFLSELGGGVRSGVNQYNEQIISAANTGSTSAEVKALAKYAAGDTSWSNSVTDDAKSSADKYLKYLF